MRWATVVSRRREEEEEGGGAAVAMSPWHVRVSHLPLALPVAAQPTQVQQMAAFWGRVADERVAGKEGGGVAIGAHP